jgi:hypothetical protein
MTTVSPSARSVSYRTQFPGLLRWVTLVIAATASTANAQQPPVHWLHAGATPPGAIGSLRLARGGPVSGYFQPVRIRAPQGAWISLAEEGSFGATHSGETLVGMHIGAVYRLHVSGFAPDFDREVYPTVEVIDRLYPPAGLALRYPIPVELTEEELNLAADGSFVTRVIYLEEPAQALPARQYDDEQAWVEAPSGADPLTVADEMGRPVAILRIGGRQPSRNNTAAVPCDPPYIQYDPAGCDISDGP